jgi:hypothetical protein
LRGATRGPRAPKLQAWIVRAPFVRVDAVVARLALPPSRETRK